MQSSSRDTSGLNGRLQKLVAILVLVDVIAVYAYCLGLKSIYPPSHPWSGLTLILLSVTVMLSRRPAGLIWAGLCGMGLSAGLWTLASI